MASYNKVLLMGNLTRDPEIRYTPKGTAVVEVGLAVNRRYTVDNETKEEVTFVDITFWGRQAETISQYCKKGRPLFVEGRLQLDSWDDRQTGKKVYKLRVIGENFQFLGSPRDSTDSEGGVSRPAAGKPTGATAPAAADEPAAGFEDEQIPF
ncbi:MAG: single-stranded DNA-binding protein [Verrucomicrobiales bacterium]